MKLRLPLLFALCLLFLTPLIAQDLEWAVGYGSSSTDYGQGVVVDAAGNSYITGTFQNTVDFDPGVGVVNLTATGGFDIFIQKLDPNGNLVWARQIGSHETDIGRGIAVDAAGNVYTTGYCRGNVDFDPGPGDFTVSGSGTSDAFVVKLDNNGDFGWAYVLGSSSVDEGSDIEVDAAGNVYVTGHFRNTIDFDPGIGVFNLTSNGNTDGFVQKVDTDGNLLWAINLGGGNVDRGRALDVDEFGDVYVAGEFSATVDFDPGAGIDNHTAVASRDVFITKLSSTGNYLWTAAVGGGGFDTGYGLAIDGFGHVYATGVFSDTADFDPGPGVFELSEENINAPFVLKLDTLGNFKWATTFEGSYSGIGVSIDTDIDGNVYSTGEFNGTFDFDPGPGVDNYSSAGGLLGVDLFLHKMDSAGNYQWVIVQGDTLDDFGSDICVNSAYDIYLAGGYTQTVDFDPGPGVANLPVYGGYEILAYKLSQCVTTFASITDTACGSYTVPSGATYAISGVYMDTIPNLSGCDSILSFTLTINHGSTATIVDTTCETYLAPSGAVFSSSGTYLDTIPTAAGCDSVITLNLTINHGSTSSIVDTTCETYLAPSGAMFSSSGTYLDTIPAASGCDSIITLELIINNNSSSSITAAACGAYMAPSGAVYSSSGTYMDTIATVAGCDSVITLMLTIDTLNTGLSVSGPTATAAMVGASYQWLDCDAGMAMIPGATSQSYTAISNGNYAVAITNGACTDTSGCGNITIVGLESQSFTSPVSLFPNPTQNMVTLDWHQELAEVEITLFDIQGKQLFQTQAYGSNRLSLSLSEYPDGLYLIQLEHESGSSTHKLLVQRAK